MQYAGKDIILTVDCAEEDVACHVGLVTQYIPQIKLDNVQNTVAVVVGPPAMMRFSVQGLHRHFIDRIADCSAIRKYHYYRYASSPHVTATYFARSHSLLTFASMYRFNISSRSPRHKTRQVRHGASA